MSNLELVTKMISRARVTNSWVDTDHVGDKQVRFELTWDKISTTFKYFATEFTYEGNRKIYFNHDYDSAGRLCPLCNENGFEDCVELPEEAFELLKDKLVQQNLKVIYVFK